MAGTVRTRIDREGVGIRPFPPTAYPPPSPWSPRREGKKETWTEIKQKERGGGEGGGGGGGRRDATRRRIVCDFVLPLAATSRSRSSISHTSVPSRGRRPRRDRTRVHTYACTECVCVCVSVCKRTQSGLKSWYATLLAPICVLFHTAYVSIFVASQRRVAVIFARSKLVVNAWN